MPAPLSESRTAIPTLVVVLGLAASWFTWSVVSAAEDAADQQRVEERAARLAAQLQHLVDHEGHVLELLQERLAGAPAAEAACQAALRHGLFLAATAERPMSWVGWARPVAPGALDGWDGGGVVPHAPDGGPPVAPPGPPEDFRHWILADAAAAGADSPLPGLDLSSDPERLLAIEQAVKKGVLVASGPLGRTLPAHDDPGRVILLVRPVFAAGGASAGLQARAARLQGVLVGEVDVQTLLEEVVAREPQPGERLLNVVLEHNLKPTASVGPPGLAGEAAAQARVLLVDQEWMVVIRPAEPLRRTFMGWIDRTSVVLPPSILVVMCLVSWIVWSQQRQTALVRDQVARQTAELRQQNLVLEGKERELEEANRRLLEMSNTDALTGILNRRAFEVQLDKEVERSKRTGQPYGLLIFDIDSFKDFNDRYGHAAGDEVLRRVAQLMANEARRIDCVARYGGEEFVVIASGSDAAGLMALGERVRQRIQDAAIPNESSPHRVITVSGGGALSSAAPDRDPRPVFELADRCLYQAKSTGRNRVVMVM